MSVVPPEPVRALRWHGDSLELLDQRRLPHEEVWTVHRDAASVAAAIRDLVVRGALAIGVAAAYGIALAARHGEDLDAAFAVLRASRPTAVNLFWALDRMRVVADATGGDMKELAAAATAIDHADLVANRQMGLLGAAQIAVGSGVLTHCNTGALATAGHGTALGVIRSAWQEGRLARVYHTETRPWLQGSRLTAWELKREGIPAHLVADGSGAFLFARGLVDWLIVGADRIAANGDTANKIGTATLAAAAHAFGGKVMVVAPLSTIDFALANGDSIEIEERHADELLGIGATRHAPADVAAFNPVFDVTPARLIDLIVTERGVAAPPFASSLAAFRPSSGNDD